MAVDYDNPDPILDLGSSLKKEKTLKENQEKVAKLKEEYQKQQQDNKSLHPSFLTKYKTAVFLLIILFVASGIRLYVASMPLTQQWAEQIVEENLRNQVSNKIAEQYPTLSDLAKNELIIQGTQRALAAEQNQQAITALKQKYKESYKDPDGTNYLYEIDPYYFYEIAVSSGLIWDKNAHTFLPLFENWWYSLIAAFIPDISFVRAISFIPLLFTILCAFCVFFMAKLLWDEIAGAIAALLFVSHPLLLEFSLIGFVDTNMLNLFFILSIGLLFMYAREYIMQKKYVYTGLLILGIIFLLCLFRYTWSTWYVSAALLLTSLVSYGILILCKNIVFWKEQEARVKKYTMGIIVILLIISASIIWYSLQKDPKTEDYNFMKLLQSHVSQYLHISAKNPYGIWPDAFSLIKELQRSPFSAYIGYLGKLFVLISVCAFFYLLYLSIKKENISYIYIIISVIIFAVLAFRAIRLLPYFIPFFAICFGIGFAILLQYISQKAKALFFPKEKKSVLFAAYSIIFLLIALPFVYPLAVQIKEKSNIMPVMDDAIYNSALYIKENSQESAIVSTWWDRGTFYKALAEREVHLQSAPHMPRAYWLSIFYTTNSSVEAKNVMLLMTNQNEYNFPGLLMKNLSKSDSLFFIRKFLTLNNFESQKNFINASLLDEGITSNLINSLSKWYNSQKEIYIVVIDDLMPRFSSIQYLAAWDFETEQPNPKYPYTNLDEAGCARTQSGVYCIVNNANFYVNLTSMEWKSQFPVDEVFVAANNTVQHKIAENQTIQHTLIVYQRADQWKAVYIPKEVADSMYVRLMLLDAYNAPEFEKVFDEVHTETSWVKVYRLAS